MNIAQDKKMITNPDIATEFERVQEIKDHAAKAESLSLTGFINILDTQEMRRVRQVSAEDCATLCLDLLKSVSAEWQLEAAKFLLSGRFAAMLAHRYQQAYGTFFLGITDALSSPDARELAFELPLDRHHHYWLVRPQFREDVLPPLVKDSSDGSAYFISKEIMGILPLEVRQEIDREFLRNPLERLHYTGPKGRYLRTGLAQY